MGIRNKTVFRSSLLAAAILAAGAAGFFIGRYVADTKKPCFTRDYVLYVYPDTDCGTVIDSLMTGAGGRSPLPVVAVAEPGRGVGVAINMPGSDAAEAVADLIEETIARRRPR